MYYNIKEKKEYNRPKNTEKMSWPANEKDYKIETLIKHDYYPLEVIETPTPFGNKNNDYDYDTQNSKVIRTDKFVELSIEDVREAQLNICKEMCRSYILKEYQLYKQINIERLAEGYVEQDKIDLKKYIDDARAQCHEYIKQLIAATKMKQLDIEFKYGK